MRKKLVPGLLFRGTCHNHYQICRRSRLLISSKSHNDSSVEFPPVLREIWLELDRFQHDTSHFVNYTPIDQFFKAWEDASPDFETLMQVDSAEDAHVMACAAMKLCCKAVTKFGSSQHKYKALRLLLRSLSYRDRVLFPLDLLAFVPQFLSTRYDLGNQDTAFTLSEAHLKVLVDTVRPIYNAATLDALSPSSPSTTDTLHILEFSSKHRALESRLSLRLLEADVHDALFKHIAGAVQDGSLSSISETRESRSNRGLTSKGFKQFNGMLRHFLRCQTQFTRTLEMSAFLTTLGHAVKEFSRALDTVQYDEGFKLDSPKEYEILECLVYGAYVGVSLCNLVYPGNIQTLPYPSLVGSASFCPPPKELDLSARCYHFMATYLHSIPPHSSKLPHLATLLPILAPWYLPGGSMFYCLFSYFDEQCKKVYSWMTDVGPMWMQANSANRSLLLLSLPDVVDMHRSNLQWPSLGDSPSESELKNLWSIQVKVVGVQRASMEVLEIFLSQLLCIRTAIGPDVLSLMRFMPDAKEHSDSLPGHEIKFKLDIDALPESPLFVAPHAWTGRMTSAPRQSFLLSRLISAVISTALASTLNSVFLHLGSKFIKSITIPAAPLHPDDDASAGLSEIKQSVWALVPHFELMCRTLASYPGNEVAMFFDENLPILQMSFAILSSVGLGDWLPSPLEAVITPDVMKALCDVSRISFDPSKGSDGNNLATLQRFEHSFVYHHIDRDIAVFLEDMMNEFSSPDAVVAGESGMGSFVTTSDGDNTDVVAKDSKIVISLRTVSGIPFRFVWENEAALKSGAVPGTVLLPYNTSRFGTARRVPFFVRALAAYLISLHGIPVAFLDLARLQGVESREARKSLFVSDVQQSVRRGIIFLRKYEGKSAYFVA